MDMQGLTKLVKDYVDNGYMQDVQAACRQAQLDTRLFIQRTHPKTAFGGRDLINRQILIGSFTITAESINATVYANHFARWYNTGAKSGNVIRGRGPRRGQRGPHYAPRGHYFTSNGRAIEEYFSTRVQEMLARKIGGVFNG